jgi:hypothetical protein
VAADTGPDVPPGTVLALPPEKPPDTVPLTLVGGAGLLGAGAGFGAMSLLKMLRAGVSRPS